MKKSILPIIVFLSTTLLVNLANIQYIQANDNFSQHANQKIIFSQESTNNSNNQLLATLLIAGFGAVLGWGMSFIYYRHNLKKAAKSEFTELTKSEKIIERYPEIYIKKKDSSPYILYIEQAYKSLDKGDTQKALKNLNEAIRAKPNSARVYSERANFRKNKLGDKQGAIEDYSKAIAINPNDAFLYFWRSQTYQELGNQKRAIEDYNAAIKIAPEDILYYSFNDYKK